MKRSLLFALIALFSLSAHAQHTVTGRVVKDSDGAPVAYATIGLVNRVDSVAVAGQISDPAGRFSMDGVPAGSYTLSVSFVGCETILRQVDVPAASDAGEFRLREAANAIAEVVVTGRRPFVEQQADRYVVNVASGIATAGRNSIDVLGNTPGVIVQDGKITAMYKDMAIWVDGRPTNVSGDQLTALLSSIQGDNISRIEVITNPSSRYDAAGTGGIIDIRTKRGLQHGFNGSLYANHRQGRRGDQSAGLNMNYRRKGFNLYANYNFMRDVFLMDYSQMNSTEQAGQKHFFNQTGALFSHTPNLNHSITTGLDYYINDRNIVGVRYYLNTHNGSSDNDGITRISPPTMNGVASSATLTNESRRDRLNTVNLNYQGTFAKPGQQLNIDLDYADMNFIKRQSIDSDYFGSTGEIIADATEQLSDYSPRDINVLSAKVDYSQPLWEKAKVEAGAKSASTLTDNDMRYERFTDGAWTLDTGRSNHFVYRETIHAAYLNLRQSLGKFNLQAGLRGEYTDATGDQRTTGEVNRKHYLDLFPTAYVNYIPSEVHNFGITYGRRILRPNYGQLDPYERVIDAYSFERGNPDLKPAYIHNVGLSWTHNSGIMVRLSYDNMRDMITNMPVREEGRYGIDLVNFGEQNNVGAMANYRTSPLKWWSVNAMVTGQWSHIRSMESFGEIDNRSVAAMAQLTNNFKITPSFSTELTGRYQTRMHDAYMTIAPQGSVSLAMRKSFFDGKLSLSLTANDLFDTAQQHIRSATDKIDFQIDFRRDNRWVSIGARWNFNSGNAKAARKRTSGIEDEKNRAQ